jgi:diacylglycerol kinase family enzyme
MRMALILNRNAGTLRGLDPDQVAEELAAILRAGGHDVSAEALEGAQAIEAIGRHCGNRDVEAVVVGGGDGTISAAAGFAAERGAVLGV